MLSGTYRIILNATTPLYIPFNGSTTSNLPVNTSTSTIATALNQYYNVSYIRVEQVYDTAIIDQVVFTIYFLGVLNPLSFEVDSSWVTGGATNTIYTNVTINREYSATRLCFQGVPLEFMRVAESKPSLLLTYNNIPLLCSNCNYQINDQLASKLLSATLSNTTLTIALQNAANVSFTLEDVRVELNSAYCGNLQGSIQNFSCELANANGLLLAEAGQGTPRVHIRQIGFADSSGITVEIDLIVTRVSSALVAATGGTLVQIYGQGFPSSAQPPSSTGFMLVVCGATLSAFVNVSVGFVAFIAPAQAGTCANSSFMSYRGQKSVFQFEYFQTGISLLGLSQYMMPPLQPLNLTIFGTGLDADNLSFHLSSLSALGLSSQLTSP